MNGRRCPPPQSGKKDDTEQPLLKSTVISAIAAWSRKMVGPFVIPDSVSASLDRWRQLDGERWARVREFNLRAGVPPTFCDTDEVKAAERELTEEMATAAEPFLGHLLEDNRCRTPEQLADIAARLSPGGVHTGGLLAELIRHSIPDADPTLLSAMIYHNWAGGKVGFQFLPDPATVSFDEYQLEVEILTDLLDEGLGDDPRRVLIDEDRAFFETLPDRFTIYRGCTGITAEAAALGMCWTLRRDIAEWFAQRAFNSGEPVLMTARIRKSWVRLARASEFEIVVPGVFVRSRQLKCRRRINRPALLAWHFNTAGPDCRVT